MRFWRRWKARRALLKQNICPRHFVKLQPSELEVMSKIFADAGVLFTPLTGMYSSKRKCDLCQIEKQERVRELNERARKNAIRELSDATF